MKSSAGPSRAIYHGIDPKGFANILRFPRFEAPMVSGGYFRATLFPEILLLSCVPMFPYHNYTICVGARKKSFNRNEATRWKVKAKVIKPLKSLHFFLFVCRFGSFALSCRSENVKIITRMEEKAAERRKMRREHAIKTNSFESV